MIVRLPLSVVILELSSTLRPACIVIAPPLPPVLLVMMLEAAASVMSVFA